MPSLCYIESLCENNMPKNKQKTQTNAVDGWLTEMSTVYEQPLSVAREVYEKIVAEEDGDEEWIRTLVRIELDNRQRSALKTFQGYVIGFSSPIDMSLKRSKHAIQLFNNSPARAIKEGFTTRDGTPIDKQGKPLRPRFIRSFYLLASQDAGILPDDDEKTIEIKKQRADTSIRFTTLSVTEDAADKNSNGYVRARLGQPVRFGAQVNQRKTTADEYVLNAPKDFLGFDEWESEEHFTNWVPLLTDKKGLLGSKIVRLDDISTWLNTHPGDKSTRLISDVIVYDFDLQSMPNRKIIVTDTSIVNAKSAPLSAWASDELTLGDIRKWAKAVIMYRPSPSTNLSFPGINLNLDAIFFHKAETPVPEIEDVEEEREEFEYAEEKN